jgi:CDP-diacylglycerol---glycerol-3-phosphate 3-phosphatidyltransferase
MEIKKKLVPLIAHPNTLTLFRVGSVPLLVLLLLWSARINGSMAAAMAAGDSVASFVWWDRIIGLMAAAVFSAAAITDYFDGYVARRFGLVSNLGKIMDPLADKLLVSCAFIMLIPLDRAPAWMICVIIGRELAVTGLRNLISAQGDDPSASMLGKLKTGFQISAAIPLLIHYRYFGLDIHVIGHVMLWIAMIFTLWSGIDYFVRFRRLLQ